MLYLLSIVFWQIWGDKLSYFRNFQLTSIYVMALFDMKSMSLAKDFMSANQFSVDSIWLFLIIILCIVILHFSITLQFSAYFHIYFNIVKKYEDLLHSPTYIHLKNTHVLWDYFMGLFFCRKWKILKGKKSNK